MVGGHHRGLRACSVDGGAHSAPGTTLRRAHVAPHGTTALLVSGAMLYYVALVFGVEGADQSYLAKFAEWSTSGSNSTVALGIMWVSLVRRSCRPATGPSSV